jgi:type VI secretion system protein VasG
MARTHYEVTVEHWLLKCLEAREGDITVMLGQQGNPTAALITALNSTLESFPTGNGGKPVFSPRLTELIKEAWLLTSVDLGESSLRSGVLIPALLAHPMVYGQEHWFEQLSQLNEAGVLRNFTSLTLGSAEQPASKHSEVPGQTLGRGEAGSFIERFCIDFTAKAAAGQLDPVFGRDFEIRQMIDILARRRKNNPILVGEPGVGKTAVIEGLALRIHQGDVPELLAQVRLLGIDMGLLEAGAGVKGEFENRLKGLITEVRSSERPIILFIDEAHTLIGAGGNAGSSDAANLLKPALARGELKTCAATTWGEYKKYFEKDPALARRFQLVRLAEPDVVTTALILRGLRNSYEAAHQVVIRDDAITAAAILSDRYISGRFLPDKAIDLIDTACARVKVNLKASPPDLEATQRAQQALQRQLTALCRDRDHGLEVVQSQLTELKEALAQATLQCAALTARWQQEQQAVEQLLAARAALSPEATTSEQTEQHSVLQQALERLSALQGDQPRLHYEVSPDLIAQVISDWTGIPLGKVARDQVSIFLNLEAQLQASIKGQEQALATLATGLRAARAGLTRPEQPCGVFLLVGPSGVGKTECALALAEQLFGAERHLVTINMTEFQEKHTVSRLIGSPPGYVGYGEGGLLTEAVRQQPYSVVLFDEVEKAHAEVLNLFYQIFDKGVLSDGEGKVINFANTVIVMTSNLGSEQIIQLNHQQITDSAAVSEAIRPLLSAHLKPALLARLQVVPFMRLPESVLHSIVQLKLARLAAALQESHQLQLIYEESVFSQIAARCLESDSGARNIDFILQGSVLPALSYGLLSRLSQGETLQQVRLALNELGEFICQFDPATDEQEVA